MTEKDGDFFGQPVGTTNSENFSLQQWIDDMKAMYEKKEELPKSPRHNLEKRVDVILEDLSDGLKSNVNKSRQMISLQIHGYPGAKKQEKFNPGKLNESINKELDALEKKLKNELKEFKDKRKKITEFLESQYE